MKDFKGKVAVVTGAASGIGRALAERFAAEGMKVVLADVNPATLAETERELKAAGRTVVAVVTDVSKSAEVEALARKALEAFGAVHIVCNNAGLSSPPAPVWETLLSDWDLVLSVNLMGVIYGIRTFLPILLSQGTEGHIVNTASVAGLISSPFLGPYHASKHAVVTLSEGLHYELALLGASVKVSVLCPGWVRTGIIEAVRKRAGTASAARLPLLAEWEEGYAQNVAQGMPPEQVAEFVFRGVREEQFYILTSPEWTPLVADRAAGIVAGRNPDATKILAGLTAKA